MAILTRSGNKPRIEQQVKGLAKRRAAIRRTPTVIQMEAVECGAASLAILLGHYGRFVPLEELRIACGTSRDGATAKNVVEAAKTYGLVGKGQRMEIGPLMEMDHPVIIFWAFQHFMVVNGFEKRRGGTVVLLNDPASGPRRMSLTDFDEGFTGIVLDLEPSEEFARGGQPSRIFGLLQERMSRSGAGLPLALLASVVLVVPGVVVPVFTQVYLDQVYGNTGLSPVLPLILGLLLCATATLILTRVQMGALRLVEARTALVSTGRFMYQLLRLPIAFFMQRRAGELGRRINSNIQVSRTVTRDLVVTMVNLLLITVYGAVLLWQDVLLGLMAMGIALINLVVLRAVMRRRVDNSTALEAEEGARLVRAVVRLPGAHHLRVPEARTADGADDRRASPLGHGQLRSGHAGRWAAGCRRRHHGGPPVRVPGAARLLHATPDSADQSGRSAAGDERSVAPVAGR